MLIIGSLVSVIFQAKNIKISCDLFLFCFLMSFMTVNKESLGFGLLNGQKGLSEDVTLGSGK